MTVGHHWTIGEWFRVWFLVFKLGFDLEFNDDKVDDRQMNSSGDGIEAKEVKDLASNNNNDNDKVMCPKK